jgi:hypothetical protein
VHAAALYQGVQGMVSRDFNGFRKSKINVYSPEELLLMLESKNS